MSREFRCKGLNKLESGDENFYKLPVQVFSPYVDLAHGAINREGYFSLLWGNRFSVKSEDFCVPLSLGFKTELSAKCFYQVESLKKEIDQNKKQLFVFHLDCNNFPFFTLEKELKKLRNLLSKELFVLFNYNENTTADMKGHILHMLENLLGHIPKMVTLQDVLWSNNLAEWEFKEVGMDWYFYDSAFKHLLLSKGAREIGQSDACETAKLLKEFRLSRNHSLKILTGNTFKPKIELGSVFEKCKDDIEQLQPPEYFKQLVFSALVDEL